MANYDDFRKKAKDALDTIADVSVEAYKIAEEKARIFAKKAKLNAEITRERAIIRRLKYDIGGTYYKLHSSDPGEAFKQNCDDITSSLEQIAAKQRELDDLRRNNSSCDDDVAEDFEKAPESEPEQESESKGSSKKK